MTPGKVITRFILLLGLSFTLIMLARPGLRPIYARLFRAGNEFVLGSFGRDGVVRLVPTKKVGDILDCRLILGNRRTRSSVVTPFSSDLGYVPAAFLTALLIATPLPLRRRAGALVWGMLLLHAVITLTLSLHITHAFSSNPRIAMFSLGDFWQSALAETENFVLFAPFFKLVVPTFVWILVTFRGGDLAMILPRYRATSLG